MQSKLLGAVGCVLSLAASGIAAEARAEVGAPLDSGLTPEHVEKRPYLDYAKQCVDLIIAHGTDRYGKVHSPILMTILDVRTRSCPADPLPLDERFRVIRRGRRGPGGANLYLDQPLIRTMLALSRVTGDEKYAQFARKSLGYYLKNLVDEKGLFWWGYHRHYDAHRDVKTGHSGNWHEIHIEQAAWPILWDVNPQAVTREIEAIWQWHVIDKKTGEINRHADGRRGCDFAMTGGEILNAFAFLHAKTKAPTWLDRAKLVANYYWRSRHPETGLIPNRPNAGKGRFDGWHIDTSITGMLCPRLLSAHALTREPIFRDHAVAYLKAYDKYGYDAEAKRFWGSLGLDGTPVAGPRVPKGYAAYEPRGHIDLWQPYIAGYEHPARTAQTYAYAYELTRDAGLLDAARKWADCFRRAWPPRRCDEQTWYADYAKDWAPHGTYAGRYGRTLSFLLHMHALTRDAGYLSFAREVAKEAVAKLLYKGLFRGHARKPYYEAADGVGYLLHALVQLDQVMRDSDADIPSVNW